MNPRDSRLEALRAGHTTVEYQLGRADRAMSEAVDAIEQGKATLQQYSDAMRPLVNKELKRWGPTLRVGQARRQLDLTVGYRRDDAWLMYLPGDVLSHDPSEKLSADLQDQLHQADEILSRQAGDAHHRATAALVRLTIGPGQGESRRNYFWPKRCKKLAAKKNCDYQKWWNTGLLAVWPELNDILADEFEKAGAERISNDSRHIVPYSLLEELLWNHLSLG